MRISLFIACYNDLLFPNTGKAVVRVLERLGHQVDFPMAQTCCGQMHFNSGYQRETVPIVRQFVRAFRGAAIVCCPSGSCVAMIREQYPRIAATLQEPALQEEVASLTSRTFEFSELLIDRLAVEDVGAYYPHRVTYHSACHGQRGLQLGDKPLRLLRRVRSIDLVTLPDGEQCCGFGGTFAIKNADTSAAMLADKIRGVLETGAEVCTATDNSCLLHIHGGLHRLRAGVRCVHLAEILAATEADERS